MQDQDFYRLLRDCIEQGQRMLRHEHHSRSQVSVLLHDLEVLEMEVRFRENAAFLSKHPNVSDAVPVS
jgi:hypothetical protein